MNDRRSMQTRSILERGTESEEECPVVWGNQLKNRINQSVANVGHPSHPTRPAIASQQWSVKGEGKSGSPNLRRGFRPAAIDKFSLNARRSERRREAGRGLPRARPIGSGGDFSPES